MADTHENIQNPRRLLVVRPHPDDEAIPTSATLARYAQEGAQVTLVTCTLGEEGEIHLPEIAQLAAAEADQLGGYRYTELATSAKALGVTDWRILGGAGKYRDSGMMGEPSNEHPRAFWQADMDEASKLLAEIIDELKPQVVITDDENGSYGHPDHIQTNRVTVAAIERAIWQVERLYYTAVPRSVMAEAFEQMKNSPDSPFAELESVDDLPFVTQDEEIAARVSAAPYAEQKRASLEAHASQIPKDSWLIAWATGAMESGDDSAAEHFTLARGEKPATWPADDIFG